MWNLYVVIKKSLDQFFVHIVNVLRHVKCDHKISLIIKYVLTPDNSNPQRNVNLLIQVI